MKIENIAFASSVDGLPIDAILAVPEGEVGQKSYFFRCFVSSHFVSLSFVSFLALFIQKTPGIRSPFLGCIARELKLGKPLSRLAEQGLEHLEKMRRWRWHLLFGFRSRKYPEIRRRKYPEIHDGLNVFLPKSILANFEKAELFQIFSEHRFSTPVWAFRTSNCVFRNWNVRIHLKTIMREPGRQWSACMHSCLHQEPQSYRRCDRCG